eukprot:gene12429-biopygen14017
MAPSSPQAQTFQVRYKSRSLLQRRPLELSAPSTPELFVSPPKGVMECTRAMQLAPSERLCRHRRAGDVQLQTTPPQSRLSLDSPVLWNYGNMP